MKEGQKTTSNGPKNAVRNRPPRKGGVLRKKHTSGGVSFGGKTTESGMSEHSNLQKERVEGKQGKKKEKGILGYL